MSTSDRALRRIGEIAALVVAALVACTDSSEPNAPGDDSGSGGSAAGASAGDGGEAGEAGNPGTGGGAGTSSGGAGGSGSGKGGRAGGGSDTGGSDAGGSDAGGASGAADGGDTGEAGGGNVPEWSREDDLCSIENYFACPGPLSTYRLRCNGTAWERGNNCGTEQLCDRLTGLCKSILCDPRNAEVTCSSDFADQQLCGPDRVTLAWRHCSFTCDEELGCVEPGEGQVYIDRPREIEVPFSLWPGPWIPVCLKNPDAWRSGELEAVQDGFYQRWGRHTALNLTGFGPCTANSEGVALDIADGCNVELARIPRVGYPGQSAILPVTLCRNYVDSVGRTQDVGPELFEIAVLHVFGHVLGYQDEPYNAFGVDAMMQAIDLAKVPQLRLAYGFIEVPQRNYGTTPSGSLGGPSGRCLSIASSQLPSREACDGSPAQSFRSIDGQLEHAATGECLRVTQGDRVGLGDCAGAERWQAARVAWLATHAWCVTVRQPANAQLPLFEEPCSASRAADQTWSVEFPARDRARIRLAQDGRCVRWPTDWSRSAPELGACDGIHDVFETSGGVLRTAGRCLVFRGSDLQFWPCGGSSDERFGLSGSLESSAGGLTAVLNGSTLELSATPLSGAPSEDQIFDFYF